MLFFISKFMFPISNIKEYCICHAITANIDKSMIFQPQQRFEIIF